MLIDLHSPPPPCAAPVPPNPPRLVELENAWLDEPDPAWLPPLLEQ
jgi:hypothetical protein